MLMASLMYASTPAKQIPAGKKAKVVGQIVSRDGDAVNVKEKKTGQMVVVNLTDSTQVEREKGALRMRRSDMDVTAMVPGLTISAEGVGNAKGQLDASKVTFDPDAFAIEVAQEQQIQANQAAAAHAQSTANSGVQQAQTAQASADVAQGTADVAGRAAVGAGALAFPGRRNTARQNRTRPPPCMRWRGPCLATLHQVSQLPGLPGPAGLPLVPYTRSRYRFPGSSHVP